MDSPQTIAAVSPESLCDAIDNKQIDKCSQTIIDSEEQYIKAWKKKNDRSNNSGVTGLALSGGGIRSATFSLGVMQALAKHNKLGKFDYLSTVSGGGYIGSALTWLLSEKGSTPDFNFGVAADNFPYGTNDPKPETFHSDEEFTLKTGSDTNKNESDIDKEEGNSNLKIQSALLEFVRQRASYLNPGKGISILDLLGSVLRGMLLNIIVWMPIFIFIFMIFLGASSLISLDSPILSYGIKFLFNEGTVNNISESLQYLEVFEGLLWLGLCLIFSLLLILGVYSVSTYSSRNKSMKEADNRYDIRFKLEKYLPIVAVVSFVSLIIGTIPFIGLYFQEKSSVIGPVAALGGSAFMLRYFIGAVKNTHVPIGLSVNLGAALFIYSNLLISFQFGLYFVELLASEHPEILDYILLAIIGLSLALGFFVNLNYIAIHRFYRDRLMETFMPDIENVENKSSTHNAAKRANKAYFKHFDCKDSIPNGPYHIINTNLVLVNSDEYIYNYRGGDNFILSPLYCGSNATGWCKTSEYMGGKMTLATAVAISGAALNPNTGVGGDGITRSKLLSFVMSFLNLRLGYWAHHPIEKPSFFTTPNHFKPGNYSLGNLLGYQGNNKNRPYLQLSDGGHFENTGIYELIRRRARLILACDGGEDHTFSFSDFQTTIRRIEDDFGARVSVDKNFSVDGVVPKKQEPKNNNDDLMYPPDTEFADQGFILAKITYSDDSEGLLIYLKTTMQKDVSFKVKGYKARNPAFPDESTGDQFFDEVQFEAYRELGYRISAKMIEELDGKIEYF